MNGRMLSMQMAGLTILRYTLLQVLMTKYLFRAFRRYVQVCADSSLLSVLYRLHVVLAGFEKHTHSSKSQDLRRDMPFFGPRPPAQRPIANIL